jgi:hypothetical protein
MSHTPVPPDVSRISVPAADQIEREKFEFEKKIRLREIELKEAEATRLAEELKIKQRESERSRWTNPILVAVIGAIIVGIGNGVVSVMNARSQRRVTELNAQSQRDLLELTNQHSDSQENIRAENTNVLEVIKLGDPDKIRNGLCMLLSLNSIKSPITNAAIQSYLTDHHGCSKDSTVTESPAAVRADWKTASLIIPGCGNSGCYQPYSVCGSAPANTKTTGNTRNYVDTFAGAWGEWSGDVSITPTQVCRTFIQHSHNITRTVSFQFEVVPTS